MTTVEESFNLIDEPWIPSRSVDGESRLMSISGVLADSASLAAVLGDVPTQAFAIQRVLIAIIRRAIDWGADPMSTWTSIWKGGKLPTQQIEGYLASIFLPADVSA
ncbi:type I-E CRISPR-associated protein Cse1/CasA [Rhodococcus sp. 1168]|uniref:type I-E CRISPR-associated protein Cse1/CasA n=1 Tax=Rhodococcus sp. 1168 TaxID=2018041 RepID=UPI000A09FA92|nr:type I-E CRISPR-associated protein Cse1/CasA [Rhodococcus sp. 1168]ORI17030.1 hypothetical protein BJI47_00395 [Rhodococcus sp. 1168]